MIVENRSVKINVMIDGKLFSKFAVFDNLYRQRRWISPAVFAAILSVSAVVCFLAGGSGSQGVLIGCVLLLIGLGLPAVHMWSFFRSVKAQIKMYGLEWRRNVYSLELLSEPDGIHITNPGGEAAQYRWADVYGVYRVDGCVYFYITGSKAFLLPDGQAREGTEALWSLVADMLPAEKLHDRRKSTNS